MLGAPPDHQGLKKVALDLQNEVILNETEQYRFDELVFGGVEEI
jgi:hypothetical protein